MVKVRKRGENIRQFILENVEKHPKNIVQIASQKFKISRQAVNKHMRLLAEQKVIIFQGNTKSRRYSLYPTNKQEKVYALDKNMQEDILWRNDVYPLLSEYPDNVIDCFVSH